MAETLQCSPSVTMENDPPLVSATVAHTRHRFLFGPMRVERVKAILPIRRKDQIKRCQRFATPNQVINSRQGWHTGNGLIRNQQTRVSAIPTRRRFRGIARQKHCFA
jgi:hypothetical protein